MDDALVIILTAVIMFFFGLGFGKIEAHSSVAIKCERLGAFYVGDKVFECKLKGK